MEPLTHLMTGACMARAGLNRKAAYATLTMTLAAEMPDLDTVFGVVGPHAGPVAALEHHRGITHTFVGLPVEAALLIGVIWILHRWRVRRGKTTVAPVRWGLLYLFALLALLSHLLLDWTNNYGVRPFFPFDAHWYAGSLVFIFEPVLFVALLLALVMPWFFGLIGSEVGARRERFRGRGWAIVALTVMVGLWGLRWVEHDEALLLTSREPFDGAAKLRLYASPYPTNPFRWHTIVETPESFETATVDTWSDVVTPDGPGSIVNKPPTTLATLAAKRSWLGRVYLDWSSWPVVEQTAVAPDGFATVSFRDLRFDYATLLTPTERDGARLAPPLSGTVKVDDDRRIVEMKLDGRIQAPPWPR